MKRYIKSDADYNSEQAFSPEVSRRTSVAQNTHSSELLELLQYDPDWQVRTALAENLNTPVEVLNALANDSDWTVRMVVARHPNLPKDTLDKLASDEDSDVVFVAKQARGDFNDRGTGNRMWRQGL